MNRKRFALFTATLVATVLSTCSPALATTHGGEGLFGPTDDKVVTDTMFMVIGFFVVIIIVFSLIQGWLDHRKHARIDAAKRRKSSVEWKGGW